MTPASPRLPPPLLCRPSTCCTPTRRSQRAWPLWTLWPLWPLWTLWTLLVAIGVFAAACTAEEQVRPPATLTLQLSTKQSCGLFTGLDYDTSCLASVHVTVRDHPGRAVLVERCTTLTERRVDLSRLLRGEPVDLFSGVSTNRVVTFEVRGLHDLGATEVEQSIVDRCADAAVVDHWLF